MYEFLGPSYRINPHPTNMENMVI